MGVGSTNTELSHIEGILLPPSPITSFETSVACDYLRTHPDTSSLALPVQDLCTTFIVQEYNGLVNHFT